MQFSEKNAIMRENKKKLTIKQKEVLEAYLHKFHEKGVAPHYSEIAEILKISKQNAYNLIKKALSNSQNCPLCGQKLPQ